VVEKAALRKDSIARRAALADREIRAGRIATRVAQLSAFRQAKLLSSYVGVGEEVATASLVESCFEHNRPIAVPWVGRGELHLTLIRSLEELEGAPFGLLEPRTELRQSPEREVDPAAVSLYLVPGLAFDRRGGRVGFGKGYYDGLLRRAGRAPLRVALCYEVQLVDHVPMNDRDEPMDLVVTEDAVYRVSSRTASADL
jgi:5-formyltetrahydrofolate cyclo-ligase